jgi:predicted SAM-dependent methyltransferase
MTDTPERIPLKARVRATYGIDADDPTPDQVTTVNVATDGRFVTVGTATVTILLDEPTAIRLDLGAEKNVRPGFIALGRYHGSEVYPLAYRDESVDEIVASHILEHFPFGMVQAVVKDWARVLKRGGSLKIAVPDFLLISAEFFSAPAQFGLVQRWIMGGQTDSNDFHKSIFTNDWLLLLMRQAGLVIAGRWESQIADCAREPISLNIEGRKP